MKKCAIRTKHCRIRYVEEMILMVIVVHPELTEEEREKRLDSIREAAISIIENILSNPERAAKFNENLMKSKEARQA